MNSSASSFSISEILGATQRHGNGVLPLEVCCLETAARTNTKLTTDAEFGTHIVLTHTHNLTYDPLISTADNWRRCSDILLAECFFQKAPAFPKLETNQT